MKIEVKTKWHGKDLKCFVYQLKDKFGCSVSLRVEGQDFNGSTLSSYEEGYYRFDTMEDAVNVAVQDLEKEIVRIAGDSFIKNIEAFVAANIQKHKVSRWLKNNFIE